MTECRNALLTLLEQVNSLCQWEEIETEEQIISQIHADTYRYSTPCTSSWNSIRFHERVKNSNTGTYFTHPPETSADEDGEEAGKLFLSEDALLTCGEKWVVCTNRAINYDIVSSGIKFQMSLRKEQLTICSLVFARQAVRLQKRFHH